MARLIDQDYDGAGNIIAVTIEDDGHICEFEKVIHAQWEAENRRGTLCDTYVCSKCGNMVMQAEGYTYSCIYNYCPNCGARMYAKEEQH